MILTLSKKEIKNFLILLSKDLNINSDKFINILKDIESDNINIYSISKNDSIKIDKDKLLYLRNNELIIKVSDNNNELIYLKEKDKLINIKKSNDKLLYKILSTNSKNEVIFYQDNNIMSFHKKTYTLNYYHKFNKEKYKDTDYELLKKLLINYINLSYNIDLFNEYIINNYPHLYNGLSTLIDINNHKKLTKK